MLKHPSVTGWSKGQGWLGEVCRDALSIPMPADQPGGVNASRGIRRDAKISQGWQVSLGQLQYCGNTSVWAWLLSQKMESKSNSQGYWSRSLHRWLWPKYLPWEWSLISHPSQAVWGQGWKSFQFSCVWTSGCSPDWLLRPLAESEGEERHVDVQRVFRPRTERGCVTGLRQLCKLAQVFPLMLSSHPLWGEIFALDTRAVCTWQDALPCTTQTCLLVWTRQFAPCQVYPACLEKGTDREGTVEQQTPAGMAEGAGPTARGHAGDQACIRVSSEPYWVLRQCSLGCSNEDPKAIFCNSGVCSVFGKCTKCCLGSMQNGRSRTWGTSASPRKQNCCCHNSSCDKEDKTATVTTPCKAPRVTMVF